MTMIPNVCVCINICKCICIYYIYISARPNCGGYKVWDVNALVRFKSEILRLELFCDQGRGQRKCELKLWFRDRGRQPLTAPHDVWFEVMVSRPRSPTIEAPTWCVTMVTIIRQYNSMKMNNMSGNIRAWSMTIVVFSFNVSTQLESMVVFTTYGEGMDVKSQDYWTSMRKNSSVALCRCSRLVLNQ